MIIPENSDAIKKIVRDRLTEAERVLSKFLENPKNMETIASTAMDMAHAIQAGNKIMACGNGGSMSDAMHFAEELSGNFKKDRKALPAIAISDPAYMTCVANDYGFESVFSRFLEAFGKNGDVLLVLSTSGNSPNVVKAVEVAKQRGIKTFALTGMSGGKLAEMVDREIRIDYFDSSDRIQEMHIKILHIFIDLIEKELGYQ